MKKKIHFAVLGPGNIAEVVVGAIRNAVDFQYYAVASRSLERAESFKNLHGFVKAYGSYEALYQDDKIDLVYIATPHAFHYEQMKQCIIHGKHVICEKPFTINAGQAEEIFDLANKYDVLVTEALMTAFMPSQKLIKELLSNEIGTPISYKGVFGANLIHVERLVKKSLGGGALLDIGIYPLFFAVSMFGKDFEIKNIQITSYHDVDATTSFELHYSNGLIASIFTTITENIGCYGEVYGTEGKLYVEDITRPSKIMIYDKKGKIKSKIDPVRTTTGYEYEFQSVQDALLNNRRECPERPHEETLFLMRTMDRILKEMGN